jgi:hypothetical protein
MQMQTAYVLLRNAGLCFHILESLGHFHLFFGCTFVKQCSLCFHILGSLGHFPFDAAVG